MTSTADLLRQALEDRSDEDMIPIEAAAAMLGLSPHTLRRWRVLTLQGAPKGPASTKVGKLVKYRRGDVRAWLRAQGTTGAVAQ